MMWLPMYMTRPPMISGEDARPKLMSGAQRHQSGRGGSREATFPMPIKLSLNTEL